MIKIDINKSASYDNLPVLKKIFRGVKFRSVAVVMNYNCYNGLPREEDVEKWPFKATLIDDEGETYEVRILSLTAGYGGTGPHDFASILEFFGVPYWGEDIFTKAKMKPNGEIHLEFSREA